MGLDELTKSGGCSKTTK